MIAVLHRQLAEDIRHREQQHREIPPILLENHIITTRFFARLGKKPDE